MWHTSRGDRVIVGEESALICRAIDEMVSALVMRVHDDFEEVAGDCSSGITIYDSCTLTQRIGLLHQVAVALLTADQEPPRLNALTDATVAAIFVEVRDQVAIEIRLGNQEDGSDPYAWRKMVQAAHLNCFDLRSDLDDADLDETDLIPSSDCEELSVWEGLINDLSELILWDRDFEMADSFLDLDPGVSQHRRRLLGIDDHYFCTVPSDPNPDSVFDLVCTTQQLVRSKPR